MNVKAKYYWYLLVFFLPIIVYLIPIMINLIFGNPYNLTYLDFNLWDINLFVILTNIVFSGIAEETGWRGYAVPNMNEKYHPIVSGVIIGFFWQFSIYYSISMVSDHELHFLYLFYCNSHLMYLYLDLYED